MKWNSPKFNLVIGIICGLVATLHTFYGLNHGFDDKTTFHASISGFLSGLNFFIYIRSGGRVK